MIVLVVGSGAREHALVLALAADPEVDAVAAAPGNPGIELVADCEPLADPCDPVAVVALAQRLRADLVVIGPEAPLVAGVADALRLAGIPCFGPSAAAARLEGSKSFAKEVMAAAGVPTALAHVCTTRAEVEAALDALGAPHVVKDDGLAAGKGVVVTDSRDAALRHADACLARPGGTVVVEEYLDGPEVSVFCICDGTTVLALAPSQDFKRVGDGDTGPNTGGMGAYCPLDWLPAGFADLVVERVARPVVAEMRRRGTPYVGVLYVGLAVTSRGPRVIEFNARFGDPDSQVVLARLRTGLGVLLRAASTGRLEEFGALHWSPSVAVNVVLAAQGYPSAPALGDPIGGIDELVEEGAVTVLHAGTRRLASGELVSSGGRVLNILALGDDLVAARGAAYEAVARVELRGSHYRTDIAAPQPAPPPPVDNPQRHTFRTVLKVCLCGGGVGTMAGMPTSPPVLDGFVHRYSGKVRDLYAPLDPATGEPRPDQLLLVASDRISAYDVILDTPIPDKGTILTQLSLWWFDQLADLVPNHVVSTDVPAAVAGRAILVRSLRMLPVECVARAYLTGGGLSEYLATGTVSGVALPPGLTDGSRLPAPVFTPSTKAPAGQHDEPIGYAAVVDLVGATTAARAAELTTAILARANAVAAERGILIADTKVEFGLEPSTGATGPTSSAGGGLVLADEVLTPDSSRFWPADLWRPGGPQPSYDKQFVRDWLTSPASGWDRHGTDAPPPLPAEVVDRTRAKYVEAYERLTGRTF